MVPLLTVMHVDSAASVKPVLREEQREEVVWMCEEGSCIPSRMP